MKKRIILLLTAACLCLACVFPLFSSAADIYFTAINDVVQPLSDEDMPIEIRNVVYLPYTFFTSNRFGIYYLDINAGTFFCLYDADTLLYFDAMDNSAFDGEGNSYTSALIMKNGRPYVSASTVCQVFDMWYAQIFTTLGWIARINTEVPQMSDQAFAEYAKPYMKKALAEYENAGATPSAAPTQPTYSAVTVFLSFRDIDEENTPILMDTLKAYGADACFFITARETETYPELVRQIAGRGYSLGLLLEEGDTLDEAASLLYEAAKIKTFCVVTDEGYEMSPSDSKRAVLWNAYSAFSEEERYTVNGVRKMIGTANGTRNMLMFDCDDNALSVLPPLLMHLDDYKYDIGCICETEIPPISVD